MSLLISPLLAGWSGRPDKTRDTDRGYARIRDCLDQSRAGGTAIAWESGEPVPTRSVFCPACFTLIADGVDPCPSCGQPYAATQRRGYAYELANALDHPNAVVRLRAITALGCRGDGDAVDALVALTHAQPLDVPQTRAVAEALAGMQPPAWSALNHLATEHPSPLARLVARRQLAALWTGQVVPCCARVDA